MKVNIGKLDLIKGNLYTDSHKQMVYVDKKKKIGYIIPKNISGLFRVMMENTLASILVGLLVWGEWGVVFGIASIVVVWIGMYIVKIIILKKCDCGEIDELPINRSVEESLKDETKTSLLIKGAGTLALAIALVVYSVFFAKFDLNTTDGMISVVAVIATTIYSLYICFNFLKLGFKRK